MSFRLGQHVYDNMSIEVYISSTVLAFFFFFFLALIVDALFLLSTIHHGYLSALQQQATYRLL